MKTLQLIGYATFIGSAVGVKVAFLINHFTVGKMALSDLQFGLALGSLLGLMFSLFLIFRFKNIITDSSKESNAIYNFINGLNSGSDPTSVLDDRVK